jgi:hypothetical protein
VVCAQEPHSYHSAQSIATHTAGIVPIVNLTTGLFPVYSRYPWVASWLTSWTADHEGGRLALREAPFAVDAFRVGKDSRCVMALPFHSDVHDLTRRLHA